MDSVWRLRVRTIGVICGCGLPARTVDGRIGDLEHGAWRFGFGSGEDWLSTEGLSVSFGGLFLWSTGYICGLIHTCWINNLRVSGSSGTRRVVDRDSSCEVWATSGSIVAFGCSCVCDWSSRFDSGSSVAGARNSDVAVCSREEDGEK